MDLTEAAPTAAVVAELGLPGIADIHVHFMPPRVMAAVWRYFDAAGPMLGREWPIRYRGDDDERVGFLRAAGVRRFAGLSYAHKPGMARFLTQWSLDFAARTPGALATGTFFPEPGVLADVRAAIEGGCQLFKIHMQVSDFDPRLAELDPVWGLLAEANVPTIVHCGSGPMPGRFTGPGPIGDVLTRHPRLPIIVAHCGAPEEAEFIALARRFDGVGLDTTMVDTDFFDELHRFDRTVLPALRDLGLAGRVFFGTDFPNIPYPYGHQLEVLQHWDLGDDWLRAVLWHNATTRWPTPPSGP